MHPRAISSVQRTIPVYRTHKPVCPRINFHVLLTTSVFRLEIACRTATVQPVSRAWNPFWSASGQGSTIIGTSTSAGGDGDGDGAGRETSSGSWRRRISRSPPRCEQSTCRMLAQLLSTLLQRLEDRGHRHKTQGC